MAQQTTKRITAGGRRRAKIRSAVAGLVLCLAGGVEAQTLVVEAAGERIAEVSAGGGAAERALQTLAAEGFVYARVDSVDSARVYVTPGPRAVVREVVVEADSLEAQGYRDALSFREGDPPSPVRLAEALERVRTLARVEGFADPRVSSALEIVGGDSLRLAVRVREGERLLLDRVVLTGARRASPAFALRASGLDAGVALTSFDAARVRQSLVDTGAFVTVGVPALALDADGRLVVEVPVDEGPPGAVDAVLGYLPPASGRTGQLVGTARVDLASPFGGGRTLSLALDRDPGLASRFSASASDPFLFGLPLRGAVGFDGEGRDSTYNRQRASAEAGIRVAPGLTLALTASREGVQPGRAGAREEAGGDAPRVRRSSAWFGGVALRYSSLDSRRAPRRGLLVFTSAEQGVRSRDPLDAVAEPTRLGQQRVDASVRVFVPVWGRLVGVVGGDGRVLLTDREATTEASRYDEGELFRFGGATSLRGYDEESLLGNAVGRVLAEARVGLGGEAFAFAFGDLGAVRRPPLAGEAGETRVLPGYGVGAQLETGLGLVALTYALNPDLPASRGKVHLRLQLGL